MVRSEALPKGAAGLSQRTVHGRWLVPRWEAQPKGATGLSSYLPVRNVYFEDEVIVS